jgi:hypothetical protein
MKRFKQLVRETAVEPDVPSIAARTLKEKPNKEPMAKLKEGRLSQRHPLEGHEYHKKSNEALIHIAKDAHKAAEAMKGHNTDAENKYRDQANDSATVRHFRQKSGMPDWYKKKYGHMKEENDTTEKVEMVQSQLHFIKYACEEILEYIEEGGKVEEWYQVKVAKSFSEFESLHAFIEGESRRTGMKEEIEQLDELSKEKLGWYLRKASKHMDKKGENMIKRDKKFNPGYNPLSRQVGGATQRMASIAQASAKYMNKEEVEQIDELSNELLGRYKDKAADDAMKADKEGDYKRGDKRFSGVVKATNKQFATMRKKPFGEEVEELEEGENEQVKGGDPCWKGYEMVGMKKKNGKKVPNCVPTNEEKQEPPFDPDPPKKRQVVPGKHGAAYSTARHLARRALKKQAEKMKPVKESLDESRKAEIVKEIVKKKKNEKNDTESFQKEPVLSSEITKA